MITFLPHDGKARPGLVYPGLRQPLREVPADTFYSLEPLQERWSHAVSAHIQFGPIS